MQFKLPETQSIGREQKIGFVLTLTLTGLHRAANLNLNSLNSVFFQNSNSKKVS